MAAVQRTMRVDYYNAEMLEASVDASLKDALARERKAHESARREMAKSDSAHILYSVTTYSENDEIDTIRLFRNTGLSDDELEEYVGKYPSAVFGVLHAGTHKKACQIITERVKSREIRPITLKTANAFVDKNHRHHNGTVGCKFAVGLYEKNELIGVAICGRPVSRHLDTGMICEVNRLCTKGGENACSQLYSACARIAENMGYDKIITYILKSENGASLKASGFVCEGVAGGTHWTGERDKGQDIPSEMKTRWARNFK